MEFLPIFFDKFDFNTIKTYKLLFIPKFDYMYHRLQIIGTQNNINVYY